jgi:hypothetical protein
MQIVVQAPQPAAQFFAHFGIEGTKGFIEQQDFGLNGQGACQGAQGVHPRCYEGGEQLNQTIPKQTTNTTIRIGKLCCS